MPRVPAAATLLATAITWAACSACAVPVASAPDGGVPAPDRPNVVFVLADDLGWGDLAAYGHPHVKTPNLDRLAAEGTLFTSFYAASPVCSPSRAAFLTGRFPAPLGVHDYFASAGENRARGMSDALDPSLPTLASALRAAGYATAHFGKWHLGARGDAPEPAAYGFDAARSIAGKGPTWPREGDAHFRARSTGLIVDEAISFLEALDAKGAERADERPFYLQIWPLLVHGPLHPTDEQLRPYRDHAPAPRLPYAGAQAIYWASVTEMDRQIGRLLEFLDGSGRAGDTIVVFSSDQGPEDISNTAAAHSGVGSTGPFRGRKRSLYEGGVRVPFLVRWPGRVPAGRIDDRSVLSAVDLMPTILSLAGVDPPERARFDGEDVSPVLRGAPRDRTRPLYWEARFPGQGHVLDHSPRLAMREGPWKLLMNPGGSRVELYEIPSDPSEIANAAQREPARVRAMSKSLMDWQAGLPDSPVPAVAGERPWPWPVRKP